MPSHLSVLLYSSLQNTALSLDVEPNVVLQSLVLVHSHLLTEELVVLLLNLQLSADMVPILPYCVDSKVGVEVLFVLFYLLFEACKLNDVILTFLL